LAKFDTSVRKFRDGFRWIIGKGNRIKIRIDRWVPHSRITFQNQHEEIIWQNRKNNSILVRRLFSPKTAIHILAISLITTLAGDTIIGDHTKIGDYTIKSGYAWLAQKGDHVEHLPDT